MPPSPPNSNTSQGRHHHHHHPIIVERTMRTCEPCRRRKRQCNGVKPCSQCAESHIDCVYGVVSDVPRSVFTTSTARLSALDQLVKLVAVVKQNVMVEVHVVFVLLQALIVSIILSEESVLWVFQPIQMQHLQQRYQV